MAQKFIDWLQLNDYDVSPETVITAPCCGRKKPVFAIKDRPVNYIDSAQGFMCDSCILDWSRIIGSISQGASEYSTAELWKAVRYERDNLLAATDYYDTPRIRERLGEDKIRDADVNREWLRDITTTFDDPRDAILALRQKAPELK